MKKFLLALIVGLACAAPVNSPAVVKRCMFGFEFGVMPINMTSCKVNGVEQINNTGEVALNSGYNVIEVTSQCQTDLPNFPIGEIIVYQCCPWTPPTRDFYTSYTLYQASGSYTTVFIVNTDIYTGEETDSRTTTSSCAR